MYNDPRSIFQKKIQNLLKSEPEAVDSVIEDLFTIQQILISERVEETEEDNTKSLLYLYNIVGMKSYIKLITALRGKKINLPSEDELKDSILTVICYYYKEIEKKNWKEIMRILGMPTLNTIKYGIRLRQLSQFIQKKSEGIVCQTMEKMKLKD
jgi:hypothetical protein